jgi:GT2 family glycosyltransferase
LAPQVTIVVVPRERFSCSIEVLERLYELTTVPFELVYIDGRSPRRVRDALRRLATSHGFRLIRTENYLTPNAARNLALPHIRTPYIVFVDNDILVTPGWLESLLAAAEETGAWAVGPLYFEGDPADEVIHMAGGDLAFSGEAGRRQITTDARRYHQRLADAPGLVRERCDYIEFHCVLLRSEALDAIGRFDDRYQATREHLDLCLRIGEAGREVWLEPASRVTYLSPPPVPLSDLTYFWLRWSDAWSLASMHVFCQDYGIDPAYAERIFIMRNRRLLAFSSLFAWVGRRLGKRAEKSTREVVRRLEPVGNRVLTTVLIRAGRAAPPTPVTATRP